MKNGRVLTRRHSTYQPKGRVSGSFVCLLVCAYYRSNHSVYRNCLLLMGSLAQSFRNHRHLTRYYTRPYTVKASTVRSLTRQIRMYFWEQSSPLPHFQKVGRSVLCPKGLVLWTTEWISESMHSLFLLNSCNVNGTEFYEFFYFVGLEISWTALEFITINFDVL